MDVHVFCLNFPASPTDPTVLKHRKFSMESHEYRSIDEIAQSYKQVFVPWAVPVVCRIQFVDFKDRRYLSLNSNRVETLSSLVEKNRDHVTEDNKVVLMLGYYNVSPKYPYSLLKFCVEFNIKAHYFSPSDKKLSASTHKHLIADILERTDPFINKTLIETVQSFIETTLNES